MPGEGGGGRGVHARIVNIPVQLAYAARMLKSKKEGPTTYSLSGLEVTVWGRAQLKLKHRLICAAISIRV